MRQRFRGGAPPRERDGAPVRRCPRPPDYPMQTMLAVFDFPDRSAGGDDGLVPELVVDVLRWSPLDAA